MGITEDNRIVIKICEMYYINNVSQKEISAELGISRPQISRILQYARTNKLISIELNNPFAEESKYERRLVETYGLKDAMVFLQKSPCGTEEQLREFGVEVAAHLHAYIADNDCVGVMSGRTVSSAIYAIKKLARSGLEIVPLVGGIMSTGSHYHANSIAQKLAEVSGGKYCILNAPIIMHHEQSRDMLLRESQISSILQKGTQCDVAIVGIGDMNSDQINILGGALTDEDIEQLREAGAVSSVCISFFDKKGTLLTTEIERRCIGQSLKDLKKARIIALAAGRSKVEAIQAALRGGEIDIFMTNLDTATAILDG